MSVPRKCLKCGLEFVPKKKTTKYCSHACYASRFGTVTKACETCSKEFTVAYRFRDQRACSFECAKPLISATLTMTEKRTCEICGHEFVRNQYALKHEAARYCSQACVSIAHRRELTCETCGVKFSVYASVADRRRFCSKSCAHSGKNNSMFGVKGVNHPTFGQIPWTTGLTAKTDPRVKAMAEKMSQIISAKIVSGEWTHVKGFVSGWHKSSKCGRQFYHSSYELRYFEMLDADDDVLAYESEPFSIPYVFEGMIKNHTPDLFVTRRRRKQLVEVKPAALTNEPMNMAKTTAAVAWCEQNGIEHLVVTEDQLSVT